MLPPNSDWMPAPILPITLRERTVMPRTRPRYWVTRCPSISLVVVTSMRMLLDALGGRRRVAPECSTLLARPWARYRGLASGSRSSSAAMKRNARSHVAAGVRRLRHGRARDVEIHKDRCDVLVRNALPLHVPINLDLRT